MNLITVEADIKIEVVGRGSFLQLLGYLDPCALDGVLSPFVIGFGGAVLEKAHRMDELLNAWREHARETVALLCR